MKSLGRWILTLSFLFIITGFSFVGGVAVERSGMLPGSMRSQPESIDTQFNIFWQAWDLVQKHFVDRSAVDPKNMTYGAISGMLSALGDEGHTTFLTPQEAAYSNSDLAGEFQGIGATLGQKDGNPIIVAPLEGSPAEKAGILPGDILVEVDGQSVAGWSTDKVVQIVRGPEGTKVTLTVVHSGQFSLSHITITRAKIQMHAVTWSMIPGTDIAHLRISQFSANTNEDLVKALQEVQSKGAKSMVVDLRSNTGGFLDQCILVTSQFLSTGNVLIQQDADGKRQVSPVMPGGKATDIPIVVLTNKGTASAGEIFAGAIQDAKRGTLVGETTFGTGTVLSSFTLSDGSLVRLGTSQWLTPTGRQIWKHGIEPDVKVELPASATPVTPSTETGMTAEQFRASTDPQVLKAVEILEKK